MFASNTVTVLREEEAYSFLSLVSDCGGGLGLFIGFNFLMFWDSVVWALKKIRVKLCGGGSVLRFIDRCLLPIGCIKILENWNNRSDVGSKCFNTVVWSLMRHHGHGVGTTGVGELAHSDPLVCLGIIPQHLSHFFYLVRTSYNIACIQSIYI